MSTVARGKDLPSKVLDALRVAGQPVGFAYVWSQIEDTGTTKNATGVVLHRLIADKRVRRVRRGLYELNTEGVCRYERSRQPQAPDLIEQLKYLGRDERARWHGCPLVNPLCSNDLCLLGGEHVQHQTGTMSEPDHLDPFLVAPDLGFEWTETQLVTLGAWLSDVLYAERAERIA